MKNSVKDKETTIKMRISQISETLFSISENLSKLSTITMDKLNMQLGFGLKPDKNNNLFTVIIMMRYKYQTDKKVEDLISIDVSTVFEIPDIENFFEFKAENFNDKVQLVPEMLNIAIGATRGMLAAKVAGTALAKFPMPMIDLEKLIKNAEIK